MPTGRFAPSPSGSLHVGNLRTALLAWLFARADNAAFAMRVDDLDPGRSRDTVAVEQLDDLCQLGIDWDGPVLYQSQRRAAHDAALDRLVDADLVYPCYCTRREIAEAAAAPHGTLAEGAYPGTCRSLSRTEQQRRAAQRPAALRLRAGGARRSFVDRLHGTVQGAIDDFVVRRNDGAPAYNLAVVIDDAHQGVEEVVRGDDLVDTTPRQVLLAELLELPVPSYAHVPLVVGPDGERLAKRHGATTLADLRVVGVDAAAVRSMLAASLGLAEPGEPVSAPELIERFDPDAVPPAPWMYIPPTPGGSGFA